jgi:SAM-dependent methyltransferase
MGLFNGWFGTRWYSMLYGHRDESDAVATALPIIGKLGLGTGDRMLDMGCGRGRHAGVFSRNGLSVTGIDLSAESLAEAAKRVPEGHFEVFDIRKPYAQGCFDAVVCLFTCLGYSGDRRDDQRAVNAAASALRPQGAFVLDLLNGPWVCRHLVPEESMDICGIHFHIKRSIEHGNVVKRITVTENGRQCSFEERVHAWDVEEVKEMVLAAGLGLEELTDGSMTASFDPRGSDRIVAWTRKPA